MTKFKINTTYEMRFICDAELNPGWKCVKRTAKTATFKRGSETISRRIKERQDAEYVLYASYSMAPVISANRIK